MKWHWIPLILAVPFFGLPSPWPLISIIVVPLIWVAIWLAGGKPLVKTPLNIPLLILSIMILVSTLVTYDLNISVGFVAGAVLGLAAFFTVARYARTPKGWWICFFLFAASNLFLTAAVSLMVEWPNKIDLLSPITSRLGEPLFAISFFSRTPHPNIIPFFLLGILPLIIVFTISGLLQRKMWVEKFDSIWSSILTLLLIVLTIFGSLILILSQSRGGYIAFAGSCLIMLLVSLPGRGRWLLLIGLVLITLVVMAQMGSANPEPLQGDLQNSIINDSAMSLDSFESRLEIWSRVLYGIQDFPLTGMGMGTFGHVMPVLYPLSWVGSDGIPLNAHNTYLQTALDLGFPGLIALLWVQIGSLWMLFKSWQMVSKWQDDPITNQGFTAIIGSRFLAKPILLGLGGVYCAYLLFGLVESFGLGVSILNWMLTGLIFTFYLQMRNSQKYEKPASELYVILQGDEENLNSTIVDDR